MTDPDARTRERDTATPDTPDGPAAEEPPAGDHQQADPGGGPAPGPGEPDPGEPDRGVSDRGVSDGGVSDGGVSDGGVSDRGVSGPATSGPAGEADGDDVAAQLEATARERDEYLDQLQRARAEFANLNRRKTRELMEALDRGAGQLVAQLLPVLDNFGFALDAAQDTEDERLAKGVSMVHGELVDVLRAAGLEEVAGVGAVFDPAHHEALMQVESDDDHDEPVVVEVLRTGYRFKGRVLRPAAVKVAH